MEIKCCVPTKDAYCSAKITRMLDNCEHSVTMDCRASTKGYKCTELSNRPLCLNNQLCQKLYWELCGPCYVQVEKQLPGGDFTKMECVRDPLKVRCRVSKEVILKDCGPMPDEESQGSTLRSHRPNRVRDRRQKRLLRVR